MIGKKYFIEKIQDVKKEDLLAIFPMLISLLLVPLFIKRYRNTWLICEDKMEARDNGYCFFKKIRENHPEQECVYAIDKKSVDYMKVKSLGTTVQYGSILHWILYFTCRYNISSQKGGKPNAALCAFLELNNLIKVRNIFLQHGVIINNARWLYVDRSRFDMFITSTIPETNYIKKNFGYREGVVQLTGMPRFDNLHEYKTIENQIIIMPSWRAWFQLKSKQKFGLNTDFASSEYFIKWRNLLTNEKFNQLILANKLDVYFYPHRNMQKYLDLFKHKTITYVKIISWEKYDIQELLKTSVMMITDYSSVFFDMIYMKKPIMFYQFDEKEFREYQYSEGYFNYHDNPFGKCFINLDEMLDYFEIMLKNNFQCGEEFLRAHRSYFPYYDSSNSERIYRLLMQG